MLLPLVVSVALFFAAAGVASFELAVVVSLFSGFSLVGVSSLAATDEGLDEFDLKEGCGAGVRLTR